MRRQPLSSSGLSSPQPLRDQLGPPDQPESLVRHEPPDEFKIPESPVSPNSPAPMVWHRAESSIPVRPEPPRWTSERFGIAPLLSAQPVSSAPPTISWPSSTAAWSVLVGSDRIYYDNVKGMNRSVTGFPDDITERRILLGGNRMRIGRRSTVRGLEPEIDLADQPVDQGVSRLHAILIAGSGGTWSLLDSGSANGTFLNGRKIPAYELISLHDGDRINLGAWTAITVQCG